MATAAQRMTAEDLERLPPDQSHVELVRGEIVVMTPSGAEHGGIAAAIVVPVANFVRERKLGRIFIAEVGFVLSRDPDTVRAPDGAFVATERVAAQAHQVGFFEGAPDLAIDVVSPGDSDQDVHQKVLDYLGAGTRLVWVVRPRSRTVTAHRSLTEARVLTGADALDGHDVLPGFRLQVSQIFEE
jgi:Uma2 family endonuclease